MGAFINSILIKDETVLHETKLHWSIYIRAGLWSILFLILYAWLQQIAVSIAVPLVWLRYWLLCRFSEFAVTNKRVLVKTGVISRHVNDMSLGKVESCHVTQGIIDRIFGCGTLHFRGSGSTTKPLHNIDRPFAFARALDEAIHAAK